MRRVTDVDELLDGPLADASVLQGNLRDLRRVNRWLGGVNLSSAAIDLLVGQRDAMTLLDVGTGAADIPLALIEHGRAKGRRLTVTGIDSRPEVLAAAAVADPRIGTTGELTLQVGDGRALPYPDRSFDIVHTSLVVHHLAPEAARALLREMARVARLGVIVNDLVRGRRAWLGAWLVSHLLTTNRYTRHDAALSVQRAYTVDELTALLAAAGLRVVGSVGGFLGHRVALVAQRPPVGQP